MDDLRSWWEVPSIAHFCSVFRAAFNLLHFEIEELEDALLQDEDETNVVQQLVIRLLQGCCETRNITNVNWEDRLRKLLKKKWVGREGRPHPLPDEASSFFSLPLRTKVEILHALCDYRLEAADVSDALKSFEGSNLRVEPVGRDGQGCIYWYFFGMRLYKEDCCSSHKIVSELNSKEIKNQKQNKKKTKEQPGRKSKFKVHRTDYISDDENKDTSQQKELKFSWSVVCFCFEDWHILIKKLGSSRSYLDKQLNKVLEEKYVPSLMQIMAERERILRRKMIEMAPRRTSARIDKLKQQKEEEENKAHQAEEERRKQYKAEEDRKQEENEQERKDNLIHGRARRAEERRRAIEERDRRARLREEKMDDDSTLEDPASSYTSDDDNFDDDDDDDVQVVEEYSDPASDSDESLSLATSSSLFEETSEEQNISLEEGIYESDDVIIIDDENDEIKETNGTTNKLSSCIEKGINGVNTDVTTNHPSGWHYSNCMTVPCDRRFYDNEEPNHFSDMEKEVNTNLNMKKEHHCTKSPDKFELLNGTKNVYHQPTVN